MSDIEARLELIEDELKHTENQERANRLAQLRSDLITQLHRGEGGWFEDEQCPPPERQGSITDLAALLD